jgi:hypothetical protein
LAYMEHPKLPKGRVARLRHPAPHGFADEAPWQAHLAQGGRVPARHRRIATEGALRGRGLQQGVPADLVIVSDDAGQFNVLRHGL